MVREKKLKGVELFAKEKNITIDQARYVMKIVNIACINIVLGGIKNA